MSKMTYKQIEHAQGRLATITQQLLGPSPDSVKNYDFDDLVEGLLDKEVTLDEVKFNRAIEKFLKARRKHTGYCKPSFDGFLVTEVYATRVAKDRARFDKEDERYQTRRKFVNNHAIDVEDQIVLGDQQGALLALQAFAQLVV